MKIKKIIIIYYYNNSNKIKIMRCRTEVVFLGGFQQFSAYFGHLVYFGLSSNRTIELTEIFSVYLRGCLWASVSMQNTLFFSQFDKKKKPSQKINSSSFQ